MGEPAGIGGEIALKAWLRRQIGLPVFFVIDDPERLERLAALTEIAVPIRAIEAPEEASDVFSSALPVLVQSLDAPAIPGKPDPANAPAVIAAIERAVDLVAKCRAAAVVTNPVHKDSLYTSGFRFPGHTEFLAHLAAIRTAPIMMLACSELRVVPVTIHMSLREAVDAITTEGIVAAATVVRAALSQDFGVAEPRLAVAGLNPHAGEDGAMGREEATIIAAAIDRLRANGIDAFGPMAPDAMFSARARKGYDAAICMYHDQALIPIKAIDFDGAVNVTLGLPFVRTSPDHGTALNIAGTGTANEASLVAALRMAAEVAGRRAAASAATSTATSTANADASW